MVDDWNDKIIKVFRTNNGDVAEFGKQPLLLLHTTGAKSGQERVNPLAYLAIDETLYVFATFAGAPVHPAWFHNLKVNPRVTIEVGTDSYAATAAEVTGADRDRIFARQAAFNPGFAAYEQKTTRTIPVIALTRA